jgi:hypothetical protein
MRMAIVPYHGMVRRAALSAHVGLRDGMFLYATLSTRRLPQALAYLRSVATDGECFPVARA